MLISVIYETLNLVIVNNADERIEDFAGRLKTLRKSYNLSQRCFAAMLDINLRTLQDYEIGRRRPSQTAKAYISIVEAERQVFAPKIPAGSHAFER